MKLTSYAPTVVSQKEPTLPINEMFAPVFQGEDPDIGKPCLFIRVHHCPTSCPGCFRAGTRITMANGKRKAIEGIVEGDVVLSYDNKTQKFVPGTVTATMAHLVSEVYRLRTATSPASAVTYVTGEHPVLVRDKGWVFVRELEIGDHILHFSMSEQRKMFNPMRDKEVAKRMVATHRRRGHYEKPHILSAAGRERISQRMKTNNPMFKPGATLAAFLNRKDRGKQTSAEKYVVRIAGDLGLRFIGGGDLVVSGLVPDFIVEGTKKLIEIWDSSQTERFHRDAAWEKKRRDAFAQEGYEVLFLSVTPFNDGAGKRKLSRKQRAESEFSRVRSAISDYIRNGQEVYGIERITPRERGKVWVSLTGGLKRKLQVYNFEVEGSHTYIANSMIVHNCDTFYTWDGSEKGKPNTLSEIEARINALLPGSPKVGLVVSGGEPLLYYRSPVLLSVLGIDWQWRGIETSGYAGSAKLDLSAFNSFLNHFSSVSLSPKITPCLHGKQTDAELERNIPDFMDWFNADTSLFFKFVVRDQADIDAVLKCNDRHKFSDKFPVYLMPYGNKRDEILKTSEWLLPTCAKFGFFVSPRLHALIWGEERGR